MHVNISDIFKAIGPAASIIFAAWIFVSFLQVRYDSAVERYLAMIQQYRGDGLSQSRRDQLKEEIVTYRRRCALMNVASFTGLSSAILLVLALILGIGALVFTSIKIFTVLSVVLAVLGLGAIIGATVIVILEGSIIHTQLEREILDVPDLAEHGAASKSDKPRRKKLGIVR